MARFFLKTGGYYYDKQLETDLYFNVAHIFIGPFFTHYCENFWCGQRYHIKTPGQHQMISSKNVNRRLLFYHYLLFQTMAHASFGTFNRVLLSLKISQLKSPFLEKYYIYFLLVESQTTYDKTYYYSFP